MRTQSKLLLTALTAALVLATAITTATARRLELSNTGIRAVWPGLPFSGGAGGPEVACPLTIEGTFHSRTISKVTGQLIGYITRAILGNQTTPPCTYRGGATSVVILNEMLPWHIRYDSFTGRLPTIERIRLQLTGVGYRIFVGSLSCLYKSTTARPFFGDLLLPVGGANTGLRFVEERTVPLFEGNMILCPTVGFLAGLSNPVTLLGTATVIVVRLVQ